MSPDRLPPPILPDLAQFDEIIDVRSPAEFAEDHIPGAINCPVLDNEQRIEVGTLYKQVSPFEARKVGAALDNAVEKKKISIDDLFDSKYQPIAGTKPQKFNTRFDALCDQLLPQIQEALVGQNPEMVYAITCDRKGYVPTHNKRFAQPLTGNEQVDFVNNRTKRIFDDPVGRRCGDHEKVFLLQTYRRDTGEIMHDISAPVYINGRHWGAVRIGFKTDLVV